MRCNRYTYNRYKVSVTGNLFSKVFCYHLQHNILMTDCKVDSEMAVETLGKTPVLYGELMKALYPNVICCLYNAAMYFKFSN